MCLFSRFFYPDMYVRSIYSIPYDKLAKRGINTLIFDIDNTLVGYDTPEPSESVLALFKQLQADGFTIALLSNNDTNRVELFNKGLGFVALADAKKPRLIGLHQVLDQLGVTGDQAAMIGDQVFTDVWVGRANNMLTILTKPVENRDTFGVFLKRGIERVIVRSFVRKAKAGREPF